VKLLLAVGAETEGTCVATLEMNLLVDDRHNARVEESILVNTLGATL
jgi:hypothetical protein